jgi:hypothetical protein
LLMSAGYSPCSGAAANQASSLGMRLRGAAFEAPSRFGCVPWFSFFLIRAWLAELFDRCLQRKERWR